MSKEYKIRNGNTIPARMDSEFLQDLKQASKIRLDNGLSRLNPRDLGVAEMTRLVRRTNSWRLVLDELKTRPKKRK